MRTLFIPSILLISIAQTVFSGNACGKFTTHDDDCHVPVPRSKSKQPPPSSHPTKPTLNKSPAMIPDVMRLIYGKSDAPTQNTLSQTSKTLRNHRKDPTRVHTESTTVLKALEKFNLPDSKVLHLGTTMTLSSPETYVAVLENIMTGVSEPIDATTVRKWLESYNPTRVQGLVMFARKHPEKVNQDATDVLLKSKSYATIVKKSEKLGPMDENSARAANQHAQEAGNTKVAKRFRKVRTVQYKQAFSN